MNIPTLLTIFRLVVALFIWLPFVIWPTPVAAWIALVFFGVGAITDYVDGYLARKWDQITELGRMLDPIADKAMVIVMLALLTALTGLEWMVLLPVALIIFREVLVSGMREFLGDRARGLAVTKIAKWKTAAQMLALVGFLLGFAMQSSMLAGVALIMLWIAAMLTIYSGWDYFNKALGLLDG